ncbi:MAG: FtsW/RodA/SpoVE family cell cycle protein [Clostridia bacterium]|nr:FtsW/RodA/SpoVE family cell cycle protein [Clostridia bacterium]
MRSLRRKENPLRIFAKQNDILLILVCLAASLYGVLLVYSDAVTSDTGTRSAIVQAVASVAGFGVAFVMSLFDYEDLCRLWPVWMGVSAVLVVLTLTPLGLNVAGTDDTAWLGIPPWSDNPFLTFQPSELLKVAFIITFAKHLSAVEDRLNQPLTLLLLALHAGGCTGLIFLQGDDGTALVFACITLVMLIVAGLHPLILAGGAAAVAVAVPILWFHLDEQKLARFMALFKVEEYLQTEGWQQAQGLSAMASGGLGGVGFLDGNHNGLFARNNDFVFSIAAEEFGFIGGLALLLILTGILALILRTAWRSRDSLGRLLCVGVMAMIGFQMLINLGMVLRVLPVIGITLPFISAGGSSAATIWLSIGLVLSVFRTTHLRRPERLFG